MSTQLWFGTEASFHKLVSIEERVDNADEALKLKASAWDDEDDDEEERKKQHWMLQMDGQLATISITGPMSAGRAGFWGYYFGFCGYDDIKEAINAGLQAGAKDFLFVWDTTGGSVDGIEEMSQFLKDLKRLDQVNSTTSYTSSIAASAGLWLATEADNFYGSPMSQTGSIGVLAVHREYTKQLEMYGIKATVFRSAKNKALGNPYEKLSKEAEAKIEEDIAQAHEFFVNAIVINRGLPYDYVSTELATGDVWYAAEANQRRLIDGVKLFNEVFVALSKKSNENTVNYQSTPTEVDMKKITLTPQAAAAIEAGAPVDKVLEDVASTAGDGEEEEKDETPVEEDSTDKTVVDEEEAEASSHGSLLKDLNDQLVSAKVALVTAEAKLATAESTNKGMKEIVATAIQKACVAVGSPAPSMESLMAMDASLLIQQHAQASGLLQARFPANSRISVETEEPDAEKAALNSEAQQNKNILLNLARINPTK